jgi:hypothetical protein
MSFFSRSGPGPVPRERRFFPVGVFGSFYRYALLEQLRDHLIACGYPALLSTDIAGKVPRQKGEDADVYNFRISRELIGCSSVCIFVIFQEKPGELNINQSVTQEVQYVYDCQILGQRRDNPQVLILAEDGSRPASLFRGLVKTCRPR